MRNSYMGGSVDESSTEEIVITSEEFAFEVETMVSEGISYLEAIAVFCQSRDIPTSDVNKLIPKPLLQNIEFECSQNGLLKEPPRRTINNALSEF